MKHVSVYVWRILIFTKTMFSHMNNCGVRCIYIPIVNFPVHNGEYGGQTGDVQGAGDHSLGVGVNLRKSKHTTRLDRGILQDWTLRKFRLGSPHIEYSQQFDRLQIDTLPNFIQVRANTYIHIYVPAACTVRTNLHRYLAAQAQGFPVPPVEMWLQ